MGYYYGWGIRYPSFLKILKSIFLNTIEYGIPGTNMIQVYKIEKGKIKIVKAKYEPARYEPCTEVVSDIPDGEYQVEYAYYENGDPFYFTVNNGKFSDRDLAIAGAYMWWCVQSNNPTGYRTIHLDLDDDDFSYHEGEGGELYHVHDTVEEVYFNLDAKTVSLKTCMERV
tara:strand:- start:1441 stop:1950 length:510 start_codon:yes stop_codon:yes gene_type:complete